MKKQQKSARFSTNGRDCAPFMGYRQTVRGAVTENDKERYRKTGFEQPLQQDNSSFQFLSKEDLRRMTAFCYNNSGNLQVGVNV